MTAWRVGAALLAIAILGGWPAVPPSAAQTTPPAIPKLKTPVTVKVGFAAGSMSVAGVYVAIARGYFQESGITNAFVYAQEILGPYRP